MKGYELQITAERIRKCRSDGKLTQETLSELLDTSRMSIWHYEQGHNSPPAPILFKYAEIFGVTTDYLLGRS